MEGMHTFNIDFTPTISLFNEYAIANTSLLFVHRFYFHQEPA